VRGAYMQCGVGGAFIARQEELILSKAKVREVAFKYMLALTLGTCAVSVRRPTSLSVLP